MKRLLTAAILLIYFTACKKSNSTGSISNSPFDLTGIIINNSNPGTKIISKTPIISISFTAPVNRASVNTGITFSLNNQNIPINYSYSKNDSEVIIQPGSLLQPLSKYKLTISTSLTSNQNVNFKNTLSNIYTTPIDSTDKFARISDSALLDLVQKQTFKYFWDFAHPVSGLARERNTSGDVVTTGGSGFGVMAIVTAVNRQFITRAAGLAQMQKIVGFLKNTAQKFHGAFPHWMNGSTGVVVPFSTKDDGADLVETSYMMEALLVARQYFNDAGTDETNLRNDINTLWNGVEWSWFRQNNQNVLYWHWSPDYNWDMNFPIHGWNEALITYVLAASSPSYGIPKIVYDNGWAQNGSMINGKSFFGIQLPLGPDYGGPLFFAHYSFMGINPTGLSDAYANYQTQNEHHTLINFTYCKTNPGNYYGYSDSCWGLTASDDINGYSAHSPTNDDGVISPTAALSSFPYAPQQAMQALHFFYYKLGDRIWKDYGFMDAFSLNDIWFSNSYLAIDQGPIIDMIENYRSGLLWNLFMSCPEVKTGLHNLGFQSPYL